MGAVIAFFIPLLAIGCICALGGDDPPHVKKGVAKLLAALVLVEVALVVWCA